MLPDEKHKLLALFADGQRWCQHAEAKDGTGEAVRYDDPADVLFLSAQSLDVRDDVVYPGHPFFREHKSDIDYHDIVPAFEDGAVPADLFESA